MTSCLHVIHALQIRNTLGPIMYNVNKDGHHSTLQKFQPFPETFSSLRLVNVFHYFLYTEEKN